MDLKKLGFHTKNGTIPNFKKKEIIYKSHIKKNLTINVMSRLYKTYNVTKSKMLKSSVDKPVNIYITKINKFIIDKNEIQNKYKKLYTNTLNKPNCLVVLYLKNNKFLVLKHKAKITKNDKDNNSKKKIKIIKLLTINKPINHKQELNKMQVYSYKFVKVCSR